MKERIVEGFKPISKKAIQLGERIAKAVSMVLDDERLNGPYVRHALECLAEEHYEEIKIPIELRMRGGDIPMVIEEPSRCIDCGATGYPRYDVTLGENGMKK